MTPLLDWTGHPLVDVGIATLCAMAKKDSPVLLTEKDLDAAADEMQDYYFSGLLTSYLTCVFMNSEYVQPGSGPTKLASRQAYVDRVLRAHRWAGDPEANGETCVFSGKPATHVIHRGQMPLLTGEGVFNFQPHGRGGLPISGPYLTAIQALPLGGRRSEGKLLIAHADQGLLGIRLAETYLRDNRRLLAISKSGGLPLHDGPSEVLDREQASWDTQNKRPKFPDAKAALSLITADLIAIWAEAGSSLDVGHLHPSRRIG